MLSANNLSLSEYVIKKREQLDLSIEQLASKSGLTVEEILSIEQGMELFLPTTVRQKLAKGLKVDNKEIKKYEHKVDLNLAQEVQKNEIRELILMNSTNPDFKIKCPLCGEILHTRIAKLYDLEDNLILRPKARCPKCPFQLTD